MKSGIRAIGIDDGPQKESTLVVGVIMRRDRFEGVLSTRVQLDGNDATEKIIEMIRSSRFAPQLHVIFVNGVAVAGFNLVNYVRISETFGIPCIVVTPNTPHPEEMRKVLGKWREKLRVWEEMEKPAHLLETEFGPVWFQFHGTNRRRAEELIKHFIVHAKVPEPLRIAHIIASGIELGESRGL